MMDGAVQNRWSVRSRLSQSAYRARADGDYRWLVAILAATVFEGALRKWVLPAALQPLAYGAKDILALLYVMTHPLPQLATAPRNLRTVAFCVAILLAPALLLGAVQNPLAAISTYKNAVLWPLLGAHLAARLRPGVWDRLLPVMAGVSCGMALLGALQYYSPQGSFINKYAWVGMDSYVPVATFGGMTGIRATGTFSYIAGMSGFAVFCFSVGLWRCLLPITRSQRSAAISTVVASVCCAVESGSRSPVVIFVVLIAAATFVGRRVQVFLRFWATLAAVGIVLAFVLGPEILDSYIQRWRTADDTTIGRIRGEGIKANVIELIASNPVGTGLGLTTGYGSFNAVVTTGNSSSVFDDGGSNAVAESGVFGMAALWVISLVLGVLALRGLRSKSHEFRCATALLGVLSVYSVWSGIWYNHTATAFTWLSIAIWLSCLYRQGAPAIPRPRVPRGIGRSASTCYVPCETYGGPIR